MKLPFIHIVLWLFLPGCVLATLSALPAESQTNQHRLGEQTPDGRPYPRVSAETCWAWQKRVGPSINIRTSMAGRVDAVVQTFTGEKRHCTTWLARAEQPFANPVVTSKGRGAEDFNLECPDPGCTSWGTILRHRAIFENLTPGAYYHYKVDCPDPDNPSDSFGNKDSVFRAPPLPNPGQVTQIGMISDYIKHSQPTNYEDSETWQGACAGQATTVEALQTLADQGNMDMIVMPGDVTEDGAYHGLGRPGGTYFGYLTRYHSMHELIAAGIPMLPVPGNHDVLDDRCVTVWGPGPFGPIPLIPGEGQNNVRKFFEMMATPWSRSTSYENQWWSIDWGNTHLVGLDLIFEEGDDDRRRRASLCGLSQFAPGSEQRRWLWRDLGNLSPDIHWRLVVEHGSPRKLDSVHGEATGGVWDPIGACGTDGSYKDYCADLNALNVDLLLTGHSGHGLRRHLRSGGNAEEILYSYRQNSAAWVTHLRLRSDAIIVSRISRGGWGEGLFECFKYVPGVKQGCDASACTPEPYTVRRIIHPACSSTATTLMEPGNLNPIPHTDSEGNIEDQGAFMVPCCQTTTADDPQGERVCIASDGTEVSREVTVTVQRCDRRMIQPGCLRRQLLPIVANTWDENKRPFVMIPGLLQECTPCMWEGIGEDQRITGYSARCGVPPTPTPRPQLGIVPVVEYLLNVPH